MIRSILYQSTAQTEFPSSVDHDILEAAWRHNTEPSVETLSICSSKLGYYAARLAASDQQQHRAWGERLENLKALCDKAIAKQSEAVWRAPERMAL